MIQPRTIGARLGLFNAGLVLAALIGLGGAGLLAVDRVLLEGAERLLTDELFDVAGELEQSELSAAEIEAIIVREAAEEHVYDVHYRVCGLEGAPIATSAPGLWSRIAWTPVGEREPGLRTVRPPGEPHRVRVMARRVATPTGPLQLEVALRLEAEDLAMSSLLRAGALAVPGVIVVAALLGAFMARRALAPVDAIERTARTIGAGPRGRRLPAAGTNDELDRLAETLNAMLDRLERTAQRNLAFAGDVAHEVRTPLAVVRARLEEAQASAELETVRQPLAQAAHAVERLEGLVKSLLALSRADEGGAPSAPPATVDLGDIAAEVVAFFAPSAEARGMDLRLDAPGPARVVGDRVALARAVANLVDNALAYAPERTPIEVSTRVDGDEARIEVADRGPGIPDDLRPRLFERFARGRTATTLRPEGAGLGLPLVRAVARSAGGEAEEQPRPDGGTIFRMHLPLAR